MLICIATHFGLRFRSILIFLKELLMADEENKTTDESETKKPEPPPAPVETHHTLTIDGQALEYTATTGLMPMKNPETEEIEANIFFMAYTLDGVSNYAKRPVIFVFNGGPGSASVWLHMGGLGPKRVRMEDDGWMPAPPYVMEDNAHTWLDMADLVFIDPVGTGFSRPTSDENGKKFWSQQGDIDSLAEFIRLWLVRYGRWSSPLFLAGESYGTFRSAGMTNKLLSKGIALNGVYLISTILNMQTLRFPPGNDLPYQLYLPTYAATAWYHGKLADDLQSQSLEDLLAEVEAFVESDYAMALLKGSRLSDEERQQIIAQIARYSGLEEKYIDGSDLRIHIMLFVKELLRDQKRTVGRLDSRFKGMDRIAVTQSFEFDPSMEAITPPYTAIFNNYVRKHLGYETDLEYETLSYKTFQSWEYERGILPDTSETLRQALARNPYMKIFVGQGYYDLATPYYAAQFTFDHMQLDPDLQDNIHWAYYEAGHMMYLHVPSLEKLKTDAADFLKVSLPE